MALLLANKIRNKKLNKNYILIYFNNKNKISTIKW